MALTGIEGTEPSARNMGFPSPAIESLFTRPLAILPDAAHSQSAEPACPICAHSPASRSRAARSASRADIRVPVNATHPPLRRAYARRGDRGMAAKGGAEHRGLPGCAVARDCRQVRPEQCTLVPDAADAFTSERVEARIRADGAGPTVHCQTEGHGRAGCPFDPHGAGPHQRPARTVWIFHMVLYAAAFRAGSFDTLLNGCATTARAAADRGLVVNAGEHEPAQPAPAHEAHANPRRSIDRP